jgi:hypothetical protein
VLIDGHPASFEGELAMKLSAVRAMAITFLTLACVAPALAGPRCAGPNCGPVAAACAPVVSCPPVEYKEVEQTVLVPTYVNETRLVCQMECRWEARQVTSTVCRPVFETKNVQVTCCVPVPQWRTRIEKCMVRKPVTREVTKQCVTPGCKPEVKTVKVQVCDYVMEEQSREVRYLELVPQQRTSIVPVTTVKCVVPEQRTDTCMVPVPFLAKREIQVPVCKLMPKTIKVKVPVAAGCTQPAAAPKA